MGWNYRVIRTDDNGGPCYAVHECQYANKGDTIPSSWTTDPADVLAETRDGLFWVISVIVEGLAQPVLEVRGDKLVEVEPKRQLSDDILAAISMGKLVGTGDYDPPLSTTGRGSDE